MKTTLTLKKVSEIVGYKGRTDVFTGWIKAKKEKRVEAIRIGAEFIERGYTLDEAISMIETVEDLKQWVKDRR